MTKADLVAGVLLLGATMYAVFGGADFGAGLWSLLAGRGERSVRPRELIDWALGPVWEANHVWLIFTIVVLWTGFPSAFESIFSTLFIPLSLAALGIVLRGSGFAFQHTVTHARGRAMAERFFGLASVLTPFFLGTVVGAIAGERVPVGNTAGDLVTSWVNPLSLVLGRCSSPQARTCPRCSWSVTPGVPEHPTSSATSPAARSAPRSWPARSPSWARRAAP
jgi:Cytochrome bd-type quinol oxidase, subunit 2